VERAQVFLELDLNKYSVSVDLLVNGKNFCGNGLPLQRLLVILRHRAAIFVHRAELGLGTRLVLFRRFAVPVNRLNGIFLNSLA
jgi:hypothetical protein